MSAEFGMFSVAIRLTNLSKDQMLRGPIFYPVTEIENETLCFFGFLGFYTPILQLMCSVSRPLEWIDFISQTGLVLKKFRSKKKLEKCSDEEKSKKDYEIKKQRKVLIY